MNENREYGDKNSQVEGVPNMEALSAVHFLSQDIKVYWREFRERVMDYRSIFRKVTMTL